MSFANDIALTSLLIHIAQYGTVSPYHGFQRHQGSGGWVKFQSMYGGRCLPTAPSLAPLS